MKKDVVLVWGFPNTPLDEYIPDENRSMEHVLYIDGEVELWVEGKQYKINKGFAAIIPEGVEHGPLTVRKVKKPYFPLQRGARRIVCLKYKDWFRQFMIKRERYGTAPAF